MPTPSAVQYRKGKQDSKGRDDGRRARWVQRLVGLFLVIALLRIASVTLGTPRAPEGSGAISLLQSFDGAERIPTDADRLLFIGVCGGVTNQKLDLLWGLILAARTGRVAVEPRFSGSPKASSRDLPLPDLFDAVRLRRAVQEQGIRMTSTDTLQAGGWPTKPPQELQCPPGADMADCISKDDARALYTECPFPKAEVPQQFLQDSEGMLMALLAALQPATALAELVQQASMQLGGRYTFLHARAEKDWEAHCQAWSAYGDNCNTHLDTLPQQMLEKGMLTGQPLYVAADWADSQDPPFLATLRELGFQLKTQGELLAGRASALSLTAAALVDFHIGLGAEKTMGNSVSVFDALMMLLRWNDGQWATYYNGGAVPLETFLPYYPMPVAFSYRPSPDLAYSDYMMRAVVKTAIQVGHARLFCLFQGDDSVPGVEWMRAQGVTIIRHEPVWGEALTMLNDRPGEYLKRSPLYASSETVLSTFARIDIPIMEELLQYNFVLYSDLDVFFRKRLVLHQFGVPLPSAIGMGGEVQDMFPYNAGISLWNTLELRKTHQSFVDFILSNKQGLWFQESGQTYGPLDQGAMNQFYEKEVRAWKLPTKFNAKPYHTFEEEAVIVHYHGPKLHHYAQYRVTHTCDFWDLCEKGLTNSVCPYSRDYLPFVLDTPAEGYIKTACDL